jgi:hypothetical protein
LVHLICLRCNATNAADAKFCSACGAGLVRKFCPTCHAITDVASHFCQACGAALPELKLEPVAARTASVPSLTDEVLTASAHVRESAAPRFGSLVQMPAQLPMRTQPAVPAQVAMPLRAMDALLRTHRMPILLATGGAIAMAVAFWGWPRSEPASASAREPARAVAATEALAMAETTALAASQVDARPQVDEPQPRNEVATNIDTPKPMVRTKESVGGASRRPAPPPASTQEAARPAPVARPVATPDKPRSATPPPDCTPQAYALGLCAPGATLAGR